MRFTTYTAASALAALAAAQTFTDCNPMEKECPNDPAMPKNFETDFTKGADAIKGWKQTAGSLTYSAEGAEFAVAKKGDAPTIQSEGYLHFGYVEVKMKSAPGQGIISSIVLQSDNLDEVDWEWLGGVDDKVQMNYFGKGNTTTFDRMIEAPVAATQGEMHTYALNWTADALTWLIDGKEQRTLKFADANGGKNFPQTPCNVRLGNWPAGDSKDAGTVSWAGGKVDYAGAPFKMTVQSIKVINYSPGKEYNFSDKSGSFQSIKVIDAGNDAGAPINDNKLSASAVTPGAPIESGFIAPTATGKANGTAPAAPSKGTGKSDFNYPSSPTGKPAGGSDSNGSGSSDSNSGYGSGSSDSGYGSGSGSGSNAGNSTGADGKPCDCGTAYVTGTGTPPSTASETGAAGAPPATATTTGAIQPTGGANQPPAPLSSGLIMETLPAPSVPMPSAPSGAVPTLDASASVPAQGSNGSASATTSSGPAEFTGAAARVRGAGAVMGAVLGVVVLAL
jgi:hypothetical protein